MFQVNQEPWPQNNDDDSTRSEWNSNYRNHPNSPFVCEERLQMQRNAMARAYTPKRKGFFGAIEDMFDPQLPVVEIIRIDALEQLLLVPGAEWKNLTSDYPSFSPAQSNGDWLSDSPMQSTDNQDTPLGTLVLSRKKYNIGMILSGIYAAMFIFALFLIPSSKTGSTDVLVFGGLLVALLAVFGVSFYYSRVKTWIDVSKEYLIIDKSLHHDGKKKFFLRNPGVTQVYASRNQNSKSRTYNVYLTNGKQKVAVGTFLNTEKTVQLKTMMETLLAAQLK